jgi:hypothetical protein
MEEIQPDKIQEFLEMKIEENVVGIKEGALNNKQLLIDFLEGFKIDEDGKEIAINDYITFKMLDDIEHTDNENYAYWTNTGLTFGLWFPDNIRKLSEEEQKSITTGYFKFHYIYKDNKLLNDKIIQILNFIEILKDKINNKLIEKRLYFILLGLRFT